MENLMERVVKDLGIVQEKKSLRYAGTEGKAEFFTTLTIKVSGTIETKKYTDATEKVVAAKEYDISYDRNDIQKQVEDQMLSVVAKVVNNKIPSQSAGSWLSINFVNNLKNKEMLNDIKNRWGDGA
jgi:hypothetical protein